MLLFADCGCVINLLLFGCLFGLLRMVVGLVGCCLCDLVWCIRSVWLLFSYMVGWLLGGCGFAGFDCLCWFSCLGLWD